MSKIGFKETLTIEFKSDRAKLPDQDIIESVVAFANTDGGDLYLGVEDDGTVSGLHADHIDPTSLPAFIANKTVPPLAVRTELIVDDKPVLKISVSKSRTIVATSQGKILRRRIKADGKPENVPMYPYEIATRLSGLSLLDFSAQAVPDAEYDDLDPLERARLRNIIQTYHGEHALLDLNDEELDQALRFVTTQSGKLVPTFAGLLMIGRKNRLRELMPTNESAIQVLQGTDIRVNESFTLPLLASIEKISEYMNAWNKEQEMEIGLFRVSIPDFDKRAFRESLINAYCHRDYTMLGRVRLQINDEGLTISNPGGFIEGVTIENLLSAEPHGRNPALADALKRVGLAERTGRGIDRIFEGSLAYGRLLPDYSQSNESRVSLFIPRSLPDKAFVQMISEEQARIGRALPIHSLLVLNVLKQLHRASAGAIAQDIKTDITKVKVTLENLAEAGLIEASGSGRGRVYFLSSKVYKESGKTLGYVRLTDIEELRYNELVLQLAKKQGFVARQNVVDLLHISPPQAYRLLQKLVENEKLSLDGKGRYARYRLS